jgi:flagellar biosynthesis/type III secretory pathway protein FliH
MNHDCKRSRLSIRIKQRKKNAINTNEPEGKKERKKDKPEGREEGRKEGREEGKKEDWLQRSGLDKTISCDLTR